MSYSRYLLIRRLPALQWAVRPYRHLCTLKRTLRRGASVNLGNPTGLGETHGKVDLLCWVLFVFGYFYFLKHIYLIGINWAFIVGWTQHVLSRVQTGIEDRDSVPPRGKYLLRKWIHVWYKSQVSLEWVSGLHHKTLGLCLGVEVVRVFRGEELQSVAETKQYKKQANKLILAIDGEPLLDPSEGVRELLPTGFSSIAYMDAMKLLWPSTVNLKIFKYASD